MTKNLCSNIDQKEEIKNTDIMSGLKDLNSDIFHYFLEDVFRALFKPQIAFTIVIIVTLLILYGKYCEINTMPTVVNISKTQQIKEIKKPISDNLKEKIETYKKTIDSLIN